MPPRAKAQKQRSSLKQKDDAVSQKKRKLLRGRLDAEQHARGAGLYATAMASRGNTRAATRSTIQRSGSVARANANKVASSVLSANTKPKRPKRKR